MRLLAILTVVVIACSATGCGLLGSLFKGRKKAPEESAEKPEEPPAQVVGEIASVHAGEKFVLIRRFSQAGGFGPGYLLFSSSPEGRTASLKPTGEQLGRLYAADIQEGTPKKGDLVVSRRLPEGSIPQSTPLQTTPGGPEGAPWLKNFQGP